MIEIHNEQAIGIFFALVAMIAFLAAIICHWVDKARVAMHQTKTVLEGFRAYTDAQRDQCLNCGHSGATKLYGLTHSYIFCPLCEHICMKLHEDDRVYLVKFSLSAYPKEPLL